MFTYSIFIYLLLLRDLTCDTFMKIDVLVVHLCESFICLNHITIKSSSSGHTDYFNKAFRLH